MYSNGVTIHVLTEVISLIWVSHFSVGFKSISNKEFNLKKWWNRLGQEEMIDFTSKGTRGWWKWSDNECNSCNNTGLLDLREIEWREEAKKCKRWQEITRVLAKSIT